MLSRPPTRRGQYTPHSFSSWRKRMRRARWKKKPLGAQILPGGRFGQKRGAGERRILAVWAPRWARAGVCGSFKWSARDETPELIRGANRIGSASLLLSRPAGLAVFTLALRASLRSVAPSIPLRLLPSPVFHWFRCRSVGGYQGGRGAPIQRTTALRIHP